MPDITSTILDLLNTAETQRAEVIARRAGKLAADQAVIAAQQAAGTAATELSDSETRLTDTRQQLHEAIDSIYGLSPALTSILARAA